MRGVIGLLAVLVLASSAVAEVKVSGDADAWQEVRAAQRVLAQQQTYRARITLAIRIGGGRLEVVNPDRVRIVVQTGPFVVETVMVGNEVRHRMGNGAWRCGRPPGMPADVGATPASRSDDGAVTVRRLGDQTIDGVRVRSYHVIMTFGGRTTRTRQHVAIDTGLPRRSEVLNVRDGALSIMDYHDFNAPITIELPACS